MKLPQTSLIRNLPDCYNKEANSNFSKLMQLFEYDREQFGGVLQELVDSLSLDDAKGHTLNLYGEMVGQKRGLATDEQYLILIKTKQERNRCNADHKSITDCLCRILNCEPSEILFEDSEKPGAVKITHLPLGKILAADLTTNQFTQILKSLLPAGITLESSLYGGTFTFSDTELEASNDAGFCQNEGDEYGGYFGMLSDDTAGVVLPI